MLEIYEISIVDATMSTEQDYYQTEYVKAPNNIKRYLNWPTSVDCPIHLTTTVEKSNQNFPLQSDRLKIYDIVSK